MLYHLIAFAGRVGIPLTLADWDEYGHNVRTSSICSRRRS